MTLRKRKNAQRQTLTPIPEHRYGSSSRYAVQITDIRCIQQKRGVWRLTKEQQIKNAMTDPNK